MLTIELDKGKEQIAVILKFGKQEHIESLKKGNINVEKIGYYVNLEKELGIAGIGDKYDSATIIKDIKIEDIQRSDGKILSEKEKTLINKFKILNKEDKIKVNLESHKLQDLETPIFCAMCLEKDDFVKEGDKYVFRFTKEQIQTLKKDFSDYTHVFLIDAGIFGMKIKEKAEKEGLDYKMSNIKYYDPNINQAERINDYDNSNIIFWKRDIFKQQKEFRVAFPNTNIESRKNLLNVGDFEDCLILDKDTVLNEDFALTYPNEYFK
ncbi:MAG: hypothetical protein E6611_13235 [Intestinibacter bartlettii]|uniref:hypothetical protein n=1 Tax=Intestinibacter bartlettii TaxID=261299 RepID=UPI0029144359|nr:hypothetical protein [Intestinibacter bartlettii]MDU6199691.1 hypothetical protein [Intestinibacter bartlettii]